MNNSTEQPTEDKYSSKTASYYAGMPFGQLLVKTMERAQLASLQQNYVLEYTLLRDYYSYSSSFMKTDEKTEIKKLFAECEIIIKSIAMNTPNQRSTTGQNVSWALSSKMFNIKEKLFAYTSDLLNKASANDEIDIDEELADI
jgi:hypothetical protein